MCRPGDRRCVGQVTDVCGAVRHAGRSRSMPVGYPGRRMIENDCNTAAQQAGYPVGEERDPDPAALEQGTGRDLTCQPYPGATAMPHVLTGRRWSYGGLRPSKRTGPLDTQAGASAIPAKPRCTGRQKIIRRYGSRPLLGFKQALRHPDMPHRARQVRRVPANVGRLVTHSAEGRLAQHRPGPARRHRVHRSGIPLL